MAKIFRYKMRVDLPKQAAYRWENQSDGDAIFWGAKFLKDAEGIVMLHLELLVDTKVNYCPEEHLASNPVMVVANSASEPELSKAELLATGFAAEEEDDEEARRATKRIRQKVDEADQAVQELGDKVMQNLDDKINA
eukprot:8431819-Ditylum_brightwellii.AAC.1